ncbi:Rieske (2Fe-2S) protein [Rhizohabitans arisaemae]|uniref:Rieske (2Fe-2S) protein n=1 Tax=Rhizohabitans arisaemae TaxID=2720610 RepID=UPI0024B18B12|nr:Rieske (2Fe-2S) protein [Rhizohabitans arisaemae]
MENFDGGAAHTRRTVVFGAGAAGLTAVLAGCSTYEQPSQAVPGPAASTGGSSASAPVAADPSAAPDAAALAKTADIPVGGGKIFPAEKVVVTQPVAGEFKAFAAVCTHKQCALDRIADGMIHCPCHKSQFKIADGTPVAGPAKDPLPPAKITVTGDAIALA